MIMFNPPFILQIQGYLFYLCIDLICVFYHLEAGVLLRTHGVPSPEETCQVKVYL